MDVSRTRAFMDFYNPIKVNYFRPTLSESAEWKFYVMEVMEVWRYGGMEL